MVQLQKYNKGINAIDYEVNLYLTNLLSSELPKLKNKFILSRDGQKDDINILFTTNKEFDTFHIFKNTNTVIPTSKETRQLLFIHNDNNSNQDLYATIEVQYKDGVNIKEDVLYKLNDETRVLVINILPNKRYRNIDKITLQRPKSS